MQEKELAVAIQHQADLKRLATELQEETGVEPTPLEVAARAELTPAEYQVRMSLLLQ